MGITRRFVVMSERLSRRTDSELINEAIAQAAEAGVPIDHAAARMIAAMLHDGQASATYSFASTGAIDEDRLLSEMLTTFVHPDTEPDVKQWIDKFAQYMTSREDKGAQEGWADEWIEDEAPHEDQCPKCRVHFSEPHAPQCPLNPDSEAFYGLDVEDLSYERRLEVADFLDDKGRAGAILLEIMGLSSFGDVSRNFDDYFRGLYPTFTEYVEWYLGETDSYDFLRFVPDGVREYVKIDAEQMARDWLAEGGYYTEETDEGVYIFDLRR